MSSHESTNGAFRSPRSTPLAPTINIRSTSGTFPHRIHGRVSWHRATRLQLRPEADLEPPDLNVADSEIAQSVTAVVTLVTNAVVRTA
jgi:hypothetical protein